MIFDGHTDGAECEGPSKRHIHMAHGANLIHPTFFVISFIFSYSGSLSFCMIFFSFHSSLARYMCLAEVSAISQQKWSTQFDFFGERRRRWKSAFVPTQISFALWWIFAVKVNQSKEKNKSGKEKRVLVFAFMLHFHIHTAYTRLKSYMWMDVRNSLCAFECCKKYIGCGAFLPFALALQTFRLKVYSNFR